MAALVIFAGCKKDKETTGTTLKASIEQQQGDGSRTSINPVDDQAKICWTAGDQIVVNNGTTDGIFAYVGSDGATSGDFFYNGEYTFGDNNSYWPRGDYNNDLTGEYAHADWGVHNDIMVGTATIPAGTYHTPSWDEWYYIITHHTKGCSTVNGMKGAVLRPYGVTTAIAASYTAEEWAIEEAAGSVFLPSAGSRLFVYDF